MDFWNHKINVSQTAAQQQIDIINTFSSKKRMKIALDFASMGIEQTRQWIKDNHPHFSELEVTLEFVRIIYFEKGEMTKEHWEFYQKKMQSKIKKDWAARFRKMMKELNWDYDDIAQYAGFKSGKVIEATISRGLPSFAKLVIIVHEKNRKLVA